MKRLTIVRHARAAWSIPGLADVDRPLNGQGQQDAEAMGRRLAEAGLAPDEIVSSPAFRARSTAEVLAAALDREVSSEEPRIYEASLTTLLTIVRGLQDARNHVMLVGHNPGFTELANALTAASVEDLRPCAVVHLELDVERWEEVTDGCGHAMGVKMP